MSLQAFKGRVYVTISPHSSMRTNKSNRNVYKQKDTLLTMAKKEVSISLDEEILSAIDGICKENLDAKRSTVINKILKENSKIKKRLKKK